VDHKTHESSVQKSLNEIGFYKQQKRISFRLFCTELSWVL